MIPFLPPAILALSLWLLTKEGEPSRPPQEVKNAQPKLSPEALAGVTEVHQAADGGRYRYFRLAARQALGAALGKFALQPVGAGDGRQPIAGLFQLVPYSGSGVTAREFCERAIAGGGLIVLASHAAVLLGKPGVDVMVFVQPLAAKSRAHADGEWAVLLEPPPAPVQRTPQQATQAPAPAPVPEPLRSVVSVERLVRGLRSQVEEEPVRTAHAGETNGIGVRDVTEPDTTKEAAPDAAH